MDDNLIELYKMLAKLEAQVEYKDTLINWLLAAIAALVTAVGTLSGIIFNRSSKDSDAIRDRMK